MSVLLFVYALVAESVDALDLKSNRGSPSVPVQVWPRAFLRDSESYLFLNYVNFMFINVL